MDFLDTWNALSSQGIFGTVFPLLKDAGDWADAVAKLIGLVA